MSNLPDDWNAYWTTCEDCGVRYHLSGVYECACEVCEECCERVTPEGCGCEETEDDDEYRRVGADVSARLERLERERAELLARFGRGDARITGAAVIKSGGSSNDDALRLRWLNQQIERERGKR